MRFKDVFSIIGPSMIGPSSSHTAGAVRLGRAARQLFGSQPRKAEATFFGSFADTYRGHGTDVAVAAGLLDMDTDDERIADAMRLAEEAKLDYVIRTGSGAATHPNTLSLALSAGRKRLSMTGCSIGGGNIEIVEVNGFDLKFTGNYPTLVVYHGDRPGMLAELTGLLGEAGINIGHMDLDRKGRRGEAATVIESDAAIATGLRRRIRALPDVRGTGYMDLNGGEGA
ncbi:L-serine ammonia-lyase, iron-sulfur-dependent subunit beta [Cohnella sp. GCM10027633]|uniref:L-serine ammonia-lyase, iron-sulfur-dependent subunit beta n=1 Tax=unclassified Cohnella TaxID=2636738 RepID=UPI00362E2DF3